MTNSIELKTNKEAMENILHGKEGKFPNFAELNDLASDALIAHDLKADLTKANKRVAEYERGINYAILLGDFRRKATPSQLLADVLRILKALKDKTLKGDEL